MLVFVPSFVLRVMSCHNARVIRVAGPGQPQGKVLSGEEEIVQSLLEGINTVAYPKAFVTRKAPKVSRAAAEAAMSAAAVAGKNIPEPRRYRG